MKKLKSILIIFLGLILTAAGISLFYVPNKIVTGGVSGASTIIFHTFGIPAGVTMGILNLVLLICGLKILGKKFIGQTLVCSVLLSVMVDMLSFLPPLTENIFLATIFGAVLYGFGIGLTLIEGASTGGTDILGRIIQHIFPHMPIGKALLIIDAVVILTSLAVFRTVDIALYGIIGLFISTFSIDFLIKSLNISKLAFIITDKGPEIAAHLTSTSPRGVTLVEVTGAYTNTEKFMLMCALKETELPAFQKKILAFDSEAFIIFSESQQIVGNGFHVYR